MESQNFLRTSRASCQPLRLMMGILITIEFELRIGFHTEGGFANANRVCSDCERKREAEANDAGSCRKLRPQSLLEAWTSIRTSSLAPEPGRQRLRKVLAAFRLSLLSSAFVRRSFLHKRAGLTIIFRRFGSGRCLSLESEPVLLDSRENAKRNWHQRFC